MRIQIFRRALRYGALVIAAAVLIGPQSGLAQRVISDPWRITNESPIGEHAAQDLGAHLLLSEVAQPGGWSLIRYVNQEIELPVHALVREIKAVTPNAPRLYAFVDAVGDTDEGLYLRLILVDSMLPESERNASCTKLMDAGVACEGTFEFRNGKSWTAGAGLITGWSVGFRLREIPPAAAVHNERITLSLASGRNLVYQGFGTRPDRLDDFDIVEGNIISHYSESISFIGLLYGGTLVPTPRDIALARAPEGAARLDQAMGYLEQGDGYNATKWAALTYFDFSSHPSLGPESAELVARVLSIAGQNAETAVFWLERAVEAGLQNVVEQTSHPHFAYLQDNADYRAFIERVKASSARAAIREPDERPQIFKRDGTGGAAASQPASPWTPDALKSLFPEHEFWVGWDVEIQELDTFAQSSGLEEALGAASAMSGGKPDTPPVRYRMKRAYQNAFGAAQMAIDSEDLQGAGTVLAVHGYHNYDRAGNPVELPADKAHVRDELLAAGMKPFNHAGHLGVRMENPGGNPGALIVLVIGKTGTVGYACDQAQCGDSLLDLVQVTDFDRLDQFAVFDHKRARAVKNGEG